MGNGLTMAVRDIAHGARLFPIWWQIGFEHTMARFRRTILGPFWLSANLLAISVALTFVFSGLMGSNYIKAFPIVVAGLLCWTLVGQAIADAAPTFLAAAPAMQAHKLPLSFHVFLQVHKMCINFFAQLITFWVVMSVMRVLHMPSWELIPAVILVVYNVFFISFLSALASTRFRDVGFMIQFFVQILFFMTPVFWTSSQMGPARHFIVEYNPLAHELELLRQSLLGQTPNVGHWIWTLGLSAVLTFAGLISLALNRKRVVFWL